MIVVNARSVSEALSQGLHLIRLHGVAQSSRVGDVLTSSRPVMTVYSEPRNRVLFSAMRDANPFFHVMEALWMLAGRNDLPWLTRFNKRFASYSDDGGATQPGAYGFRWRQHFGYDQLGSIIQELKENPLTRRAVLVMWDGGARADWLSSGELEDAQPGDLYSAVGGSADVPCNTHAYFDTIDGRLNMTVCCRSNDIIWGAYGANAVHFSFLLEYLSTMTNIPMGVYRQFSNNYHLYTNVVPRDNLMPMSSEVENSDRYLVRESLNSRVKVPVERMRRVPLVNDPATFEADLFKFMDLTREPHTTFVEPSEFSETFFRTVAAPMFNAYMARRFEDRKRDFEKALDHAHSIKADDWRMAAVEWLERRQVKADVNVKPFTEVIQQEDESAAAFGLERNQHGTA